MLFAVGGRLTANFFFSFAVGQRPTAALVPMVVADRQLFSPNRQLF